MEYIKKGFLIILAGLCIGVGVGVILYANVGGDTITVFQDGMHNVLSISYGQASLLYNTVLIVLALIFSKNNFGAGTIVTALITGLMIDISNNFLVSLNLEIDFIMKLMVFFIGLSIYTFGLALLIKCKLGMNALDSLIYRLVDMIHIEYKWIRIVADLILTILGFIMGGVVGIGTLVSILCTGMMIDLFTKIGGKQNEKKPTHIS